MWRLQFRLDEIREAEVYKGFKSCSAAGSVDTGIAGSQTLPSTAPGDLQAHGYSLKLESATQTTQNAVQTLQQTRLPPSQEGGPMQFLKLTESLKIDPELLIILAKFQLQPKVQAIPLQPKQISCLWHPLVQVNLPKQNTACAFEQYLPDAAGLKARPEAIYMLPLFVTDYSSTVLI